MQILIVIHKNIYLLFSLIFSSPISDANVRGCFVRFFSGLFLQISLKATAVMLVACACYCGCIEALPK